MQEKRESDSMRIHTIMMFVVAVCCMSTAISMSFGVDDTSSGSDFSAEQLKIQDEKLKEQLDSMSTSDNSTTSISDGISLFTGAVMVLHALKTFVGFLGLLVVPGWYAYTIFHMPMSQVAVIQSLVTFVEIMALIQLWMNRSMKSME